MKYLPNYFRKGQLTKMFFLFPVSFCAVEEGYYCGHDISEVLLAVIVMPCNWWCCGVQALRPP